MITERHKYLVDKFLDDTLNTRERTELQAAINSNYELREYIDEMKTVDRLIRKALQKKGSRSGNNGKKPGQTTGSASANLQSGNNTVKNPHLRKLAERAAAAILAGDRMPDHGEVDEDIRKYHTGEQDEARRIMIGVSNRYFARQKRLRNLNLITMVLAAAAIIVVALLLWSPAKPVYSGQLYAKYYSPHRFTINRSGTAKLSPLAMAQVDYNQGHYRQSLAQSNDLLAQNPGNQQYRFLHALSLTAIGQTDKAIADYRAILSHPDQSEARIHSLSSFYLALCYIREGNRDSAAFFLKQIQPGNGNYFPENESAGKVLEVLEKRGMRGER